MASANSSHDHKACITSALEQAQQLCQHHKVRLTPLRKTVLELVWQSHQPLGAYALMAMLEERGSRRVAPPTVYRALDFLLEQGLIHRVHRLNAFIGCPDPARPHACNLLICSECGVAEEVASPLLNQSLAQAASAHDFQMQEHTLEVVGCCKRCRTGAAAQAEGSE